jgi:predicted ATP-binding protein involved in virulence
LQRGYCYIMNLIGIKVYNLLNRFDYQIRLEEDISIIHAPNGSGKTKFLMLIEAIINDNFSRIIDIPFDKIVFELIDDESNILYWNVVRYETESEKLKKNFKNTIKLTYLINFKDYQNYFELIVNKEFDGNFSKIAELIPGLRRSGAKEWIETETGERLSLEDILDNYGNYEELFETDLDYEEQYLDAFEDLHQYLPIKLIETNRLFVTNNNGGHYSNTLAISNYSNRIKKEIASLLQVYAQTSQDLDRTFPSRLLNRMRTHDNFSDYDLESIIKGLMQQDKERNYLAQMGLLDTKEKFEETINIQEFTTDDFINSNLAEVLSLFLEDNKAKLNVFNDMKNRVNLFQNIVNKRLSDKSITLDRNEGFIIRFSNGERLDKVYQLSSGEQHTIVLMFDLLFKSAESTLVLIDEPELSLHVEWQMDFLDEIKQIAKLRRQKYIIATHSPQIVNGEWNLLKELVDNNQVENKK